MRRSIVASLFGPCLAVAACQLAFPYDDGGAASSATAASSSSASASTVSSTSSGDACPKSMCTPKTLASSISSPYFMKLANASVYYTMSGATSDSGLSTVPITGGKATLLAPDAYEFDLVVDGHDIYWSSPNSLKTLDLSSGAGVMPFVAAHPTSLAQDTDDIYWFDYGDHAIEFARKDLSNQGQLYGNQAGSCWGLATSGSDLVWTIAEEGALHRGDKGGASSTVLASSLATPWGLALDETGIYWAENGDTTSNDGKIQVLASGADSPTPIASNLAHPFRVALDADYVYWTNQGSDPDYHDGSVMRASKKGSHASDVVADQLDRPSDVAVDGDNIYWLDVGDIPPGMNTFSTNGDLKSLPLCCIGK